MAVPTSAVGFAIEDASRKASVVEGWLGEKEGRLLYQLAKECPASHAIVEIGSWKGRSTIWLSCGSLAGSRPPVIAIDPHTGSEEHRPLGPVWTYDEFLANISRAGVAEVVQPLVKTSEAAFGAWSAGTPWVVWVDGAHDYRNAEMDARMWGGALAVGGHIAFHDWRWAGPRLAIIRHILLSPRFGSVRVVGSAAFAQKVQGVSVREWGRKVGLAARWGMWPLLRRLGATATAPPT